jgi:hypothetical protein
VQCRLVAHHSCAAIEPLVEEVAADIFMGTFTEKWARAAAVASNSLDGTLYARYYDLPGSHAWVRSRVGRPRTSRGGGARSRQRTSPRSSA